MADVIYVGVICAFFALCVVYIRWCDRIIGHDDLAAPAAENSVRSTADMPSDVRSAEVQATFVVFRTSTRSNPLCVKWLFVGLSGRADVAMLVALGGRYLQTFGSFLSSHTTARSPPRTLRETARPTTATHFARIGAAFGCVLATAAGAGTSMLRRMTWSLLGAPWDSDGLSRPRTVPRRSRDRGCDVCQPTGVRSSPLGEALALPVRQGSGPARRA